MLKSAGTEGFEMVRRWGPLLLFICCRKGFPTCSLLKFMNGQATEWTELVKTHVLSPRHRPRRRHHVRARREARREAQV